MTPIPLILALAAFDGEAAFQHASRLAALGPHPWGSPRGRFAAEYVASQFREAGLQEVALQPFQSEGLEGANVVGVLRAPGPDFILIGAHHDSAPGAPAAYDDGGGVGVLIETARALAKSKDRPRTIVFVSFDGEESESVKGPGVMPAGGRAYLKSLGANTRNLVAALIVEMCGWKGGSPVFHPIPYPDPMRPRRFVVTPEWLMRAARQGANASGQAVAVGDPLISWLYQPTVRTFSANLYGDDIVFLRAGLPALFLSDSSFTAYYPWYHQPTDTADKLDPAALAKMGEAVGGIVRALERVTPGKASEPSWLDVFGFVLGGTALFVLLALTALPGLALAWTQGDRRAAAARSAHAALFGYLAWAFPVPALWTFAVPNLALVWARPLWARLLTLVPAALLVVMGVLAASRGMVGAMWLGTIDLAVAAAALGLAFVPVMPAGGGGKGGGSAPRRTTRKKR